MGNPRGFLEHARQKAKRLPIAERLHSFREIELAHPAEELREQAARCMDCGIPFCHQGCPLGNLIPEWNDHIYRDRRIDATHALLETNNFPEITSRVCPAPCEAACVLNLEETPVTIKDIERAIADEIFATDLVPRRTNASGKRVAVVGSGPAGLAAAQQLARRGHEVVVFEKDARAGGLLRYGIPDFKLEKGVLDRRLAQMEAEGVRFEYGRAPHGDDLAPFDGVVLAVGARTPRELTVPGRDLEGVYYAMDFLAAQNRRIGGEIAEDALPHLHAKDKHVVVLGGGDTGADCVGTSHRHGARSVTSLELLPEPPHVRGATDLWPAWPHVFRTSSSHEEGGERQFALRTEELIADGPRVRGLRVVQVTPKLEAIAGTEREIDADLVLLAMGFVAVEPTPLFDALGVRIGDRGRIETIDGYRTHAPRVVVCGDAYRGASLVVWAIADGRNAAAQLHALLCA